MADVLAQVLSNTAQWSWTRQSLSKNAFEFIGGNCYLQNQDHVLRALQNEILLELMAIHQITVLTADELKATLSLLSPLLPNLNKESIEKEVNTTTVRSFIFWVTLNNCLQQILAKRSTHEAIEFMGLSLALNLSEDDLNLISNISQKVSKVVDPIFKNMPTVNELKEFWKKDFSKNRQNNVDLGLVVTVLGFMLYSVIVGFQYHDHPFTSALFSAGLLFSFSCVARFILRIRELSFNEIYCSIFIKNFSKNTRKSELFSNFQL